MTSHCYREARCELKSIPECKGRHTSSLLLASSDRTKAGERSGDGGGQFATGGGRLTRGGHGDAEGREVGKTEEGRQLTSNRKCGREGRSRAGRGFRDDYDELWGGLRIEEV